MNPVNDIVVSGALWIAAYLIGSINFSIVAARLTHQPDPRATGSGNAGATNLMRSAGLRVALPVLILDVLRGFAVLYAARHAPVNLYWPFIALPLIAGNIAPVFHSFKGGKGVATSIGIALAISPLGLLAALSLSLLFLSVFAAVSVLSLSLLAGFAVTQYFAGGFCPDFILAALLFIIAAATHRHNLKRLFARTEPRLF